MLYEPTNIMPSSMTQTGTIAATTDNVDIQWQVNGNSAMTMFQIDVMKNNADSTFVYSTGIVTENPTVAQGYSLPFYGKDRFGDYVQFVYQLNQTWTAWSNNAISDGNSYKFRITQFFQENGTACKVQITNNLSAGTTYYFSYSVNEATQYVSFTVANASYFVSGNTIYFNFSHNAGWVATSGNNIRAITDITFSVSETQPSGMRLSGVVAVLSGDTFYNQFFTAQNSASSFITRTKPTLTITPLATTPVASATQNFMATYFQAQEDSINSVRWQLFNNEDMTTPVDDTGEVSTAILAYEYNGLFNGQSYTVICTVTTENNVSVSAQLNFSVQYEQGNYTGSFTAQSLCQEDANLLKWDGVEAIPGVDNPSGSAVVSNGQLILPENSTVLWSQKTDENGESQPLNFQQPWTAVWNGDIDRVITQFLQEMKVQNFKLGGTFFDNPYITDFTFSPDGTKLAVRTNNANYVHLFSVNGDVITYLQVVSTEGTAADYNTKMVTFSPDGGLLVVYGGHGAALFSVAGNALTYLSDIKSDASVSNALFSPDGLLLILIISSTNDDSLPGGELYSVNGSSVAFLQKWFEYDPREVSMWGQGISFSPDGSLLVVGAGNDAGADIFSVGKNSVTFLSHLLRDGEVMPWLIYNPTFNPNGSFLAIGSDASIITIFSVSGGGVTYLSDITHNDTSVILGSAFDVAFSPDGALLAVAGSGGAALFSIFGTQITYLTDITEKNTQEVEFSPDGSLLKVMTNNIDGPTALFSVRGNIVSPLQNFIEPQNILEFSPNDSFLVVSNNENGASSYVINQNLTDATNIAAFSPDGSLLVLGGQFTGYAALFSVSGNTVTYLSDITKNGIALDGAVNAVAFSPDGSLLVLGGRFTGHASLFAVSGNTVTYLSDIMKGDTAVNFLVNTVAFHPDGSLLVLNYSLFSVNGNEITYLSDITRGGTQFNNAVYVAAFSPDGSLLVLGGQFTGYAALFSVSGNTVAYLSDITKNGTALRGIVYTATFNSNGSLLILGGDVLFGFVLLFSVKSNSVTYLSNITKGETSFNGAVYTVAFSPDGSLLVIGTGSYSSGMAALFSVSGNTVTYLSDITKNGIALDGAVNAVAFSPDGSWFVLGWEQTEEGSAATWNVSGSISSIENIFSIPSNNITVSKEGQFIRVTEQVSSGASAERAKTYITGSAQGAANNIVIALTPSELQVYSFLNGQFIASQTSPISGFTQTAVSSAQLGGAQTCNYFVIIDGDGENIEQYLSNSAFVPAWNNDGGYIVNLLANFNYGIDGGTATNTGKGFRLYRRTSDGSENIELASIPSTTISLRDFGIKSNESYIYDFYVYDANGAFMGVRSTEATPLKRQFKRFSLLSTQYNESDKCYHVVKEYQFSCNIQDMAVSNNSNKSYLQNFTPYPTVFQSTANYASGTLQALIGFVDPKAYKYWDSTQLMEELNALSTTTNTLFLKDMKGRLWMVDVGTVQMTATQKTREMQVTISLPWTEIGDASDVSIIQTPDDEGWNTDAQVLDVTLDVDVETGLLQVVYPFPYNGTAFYLVGVTPEGVVSAVQPLPSTASQPTDGQLKAVVRHK